MPDAAPIMTLESVSMRYGAGANAVHVLRDVDLAIGAGELVAIVGFSGAGKTTLLSIMAGLEQPSAGRVTFLGKPVTGPGPDRGVVFQSYSLMPWLSVEGNVALAVDAVHGSRTRAERRGIVRRYVDLVGLAHAKDRRPAELSGGMRQRVAVARALAMSPQMLLLDEPLSALDALTRAKLRDEIEAIWSRERKTAVLITNDVDEAIMLADRIVPMTPGPAATLGPEFRVDLPRPRSAAELNDNVEFRRLRSAVTRCLIDTGRGRTTASGRREVVLPDVSPSVAGPPAAFAGARRRIGARPPRAWVEAAASRPVNRYVEFFNVSKAYPTREGPLTVVDGFDLRMSKGEIVSLIGHSGCGKSTVLSMIAGLTDVSGGGIVLEGREVTSAGPDRAVVFQAPNLVPWLTAAENVALGVDRVYRHATPAERADIVGYYLTRVGLADHMDRPAAALSSGMKQRVGIARAFALSPKLLLLDEPFGMLDTLTRWELQEQLLDVWSRTQVTAICVTHDVDEALLLADRVVMMTNGPRAKIGKILPVNLPRPRSRKSLLEHPDYYGLRSEVLDFLEGCERGRDASELAA
ncbi:MAG: ATP-binding cassette domain-containing protein [Gammaproteobacteria bacterium]|nr:ATP-binding cassette domain-containing protein [Gammaproteobacteria bacterium]